jgi:hypothetical protein
MNIELLKKPFDPYLIKWRISHVSEANSSAMVLAYIDARHVQDRLDSVCGIGNWQVRHPREGYCEIGINIRPSTSVIAGGETTHNYVEPLWVWKGNGADKTKVEAVKGQYSDAEKRAAVEWGIGRYLYGLPTTWTDVVKKGKTWVIKDLKVLTLPDWATPNPKTGLKKADRDNFFEAAMILLGAGDVEGMVQIWNEHENEEKVILWSAFNSEQRTAINKLMKGE